MMHDFVRVILKVIFGIFYRVEIIGRENIPSKGAAILCANHTGELDMFFIGYKLKRLVRWMAKEELFRIPIVAGFFKWAGAFPIKRGKGDVTAIKNALKLLEEDHIVGIFPEGHRTRGRDIKNMVVNRGAVMLAIDADVPIIPVGIMGKYRIFSKIRIKIGEPYKIITDKDRKYTSDEMKDLAKDIMKKVYVMVGE